MIISFNNYIIIIVRLFDTNKTAFLSLNWGVLVPFRANLPVKYVVYRMRSLPIMALETEEIPRKKPSYPLLYTRYISPTVTEQK